MAEKILRKDVSKKEREREKEAINLKKRLDTRSLRWRTERPKSDMTRGKIIKIYLII